MFSAHHYRPVSNHCILYQDIKDQRQVQEIPVRDLIKKIPVPETVHDTVHNIAADPVPAQKAFHIQRTIRQCLPILHQDPVCDTPDAHAFPVPLIQCIQIDVRTDQVPRPCDHHAVQHDCIVSSHWYDLHRISILHQIGYLFFNAIEKFRICDQNRLLP